MVGIGVLRSYTGHFTSILSIDQSNKNTNLYMLSLLFGKKKTYFTNFCTNLGFPDVQIWLTY